MASLKLPRLEALLFCEAVTEEDGRTHTLSRVASRLTGIGQFPFIVRGTVYGRFAAAPGIHTSEVQFIRVDTGAVIGRMPPDEGNSTVDEVTGVSFGVAPLEVSVPAPGVYALRLLVDGEIIGESAIHFVHLRPGALG